MEKIRINEMFESISGEAGYIPQGSWCTFIRFQGCNLNCAWCDTPQAISSSSLGTLMTPTQIAKKVKTKNVIITGGEPLYQKEGLEELLLKLYPDREIQIETNGACAPPKGAHSFAANWVVDYKCPSSCMGSSMPTPKQFVDIWRPHWTMIKFVIDGSEDWEFAWKQMIIFEALGYDGKYLLSPINANTAVFKALFDGVRVRTNNLISSRRQSIQNKLIFSLQIHKLIGAK